MSIPPSSASSPPREAAYAASALLAALERVRLRPGRERIAMFDAMRAAVVQMTSTDDLDTNLAAAEGFVREAADLDADLVALPEMFAYLRREGEPLRSAQPLDGEIVGRMQALARELDIWLIAGTLAEASSSGERVHNTSVLISPKGERVARYRKMHLFDVDLGTAGGASYRESTHIAPGDEVVVASSPFGGIGLSVCYDLRFPELYRAMSLRDIRFVSVPSAFTPHTGRDHWEVLLRARAIENQVFVLAPAQVGRHSETRSSYGRSMIVDPWGMVLAQAPDRPGVVVAECDLEAQDRVRTGLPALQHRRL